MLGERSPTTTNWRFVGREEIDSRECLKFEGTSDAQQKASGFLAPAGMVGRIAHFKRRLKALAALKEHAELLRMLVDPRQRIEESQDPLDKTNSSFKELDASKQAALREILSTIPLFLLQAPPGVGKTYLVGDVVRRRFDDEPTTRILLSAQSNSAIDHLMKEVQSIFAGVAPEERPLMVRARPVDDDESAGEHEIDTQADAILHKLAVSELVDAASSHIRDRIVSLSSASFRWKLRVSGTLTFGMRLTANLMLDISSIGGRNSEVSIACYGSGSCRRRRAAGCRFIQMGLKHRKQRRRCGRCWWTASQMRGERKLMSWCLI